uniref:Putative secreted protein n=1 Tax=Anopheles darlingi TaxID=43151 RepID=A0A2M4D770_ANODA
MRRSPPFALKPSALPSLLCVFIGSETLAATSGICCTGLVTGSWTRSFTSSMLDTVSVSPKLTSDCVLEEEKGICTMVCVVRFDGCRVTLSSVGCCSTIIKSISFGRKPSANTSSL